MGIYLKGMEMPKCCDVCAFSDWSNLHQTACCKIREYNPCFKDFSREYVSKRPDWCPLVEVKEPHGRLIDADKAYNVMIDEMCKTGFPSKTSYVLRSELYTPTVIEAEGGD